MDQHKKILFVSAYLSLIIAAEKKLRTAGYEVRCAHNVSTAVRCLVSEEVDLVVLCGSLAGEARHSITEYVKHRWDTPIVLLSPSKRDSIEDLLRALAAVNRERAEGAEAA